MQSILLVEDEVAICAEFARTLRRLGFEVKTAHSLEGALRSLRTNAFDVVVLEWNLRSELRARPRSGNGLQLVRRMHASGLSTPVLICTAMEGEEYAAASIDAGAHEFIAKSAGLDYLVSRLRAACVESASVTGN